MAVRRVGGDTSRVVLIIFSFVLWAAGLGMIFLGVWMLVDPRRSYVLELVHFSADDPLLVFAAYTSVCAGVAALAVGFIACCGALKRIRCMITCLMICMFLLSLCGVAIGTLGLVYRDKFPTDERITRYLTNLTYDRYSRQKWVAPLMDTMQFYQQCCGGEGARDYYGSFWYVTNTERGTRSFVPASCCRQQQKARAWVIAPLDPLCTTFAYDRPAIQDAVHSEGCGSKLHAWFNEQTAIFAGFGFGFAALQVVGMGIALIFCNSIHYGDYIKGEEI